MSAQANTDPARRTVEHEVEAKQGTDAPKGMPVVLVVGTLAAAVGMFIVYAVFFG